MINNIVLPPIILAHFKLILERQNSGHIIFKWLYFVNIVNATRWTNNDDRNAHILLGIDDKKLTK